MRGRRNQTRANSHSRAHLPYATTVCTHDTQLPEKASTTSPSLNLGAIAIQENVHIQRIVFRSIRIRRSRREKREDAKESVYGRDDFWFAEDVGELRHHFRDAELLPNCGPSFQDSKPLDAEDVDVSMPRCLECLSAMSIPLSTAPPPLFSSQARPGTTSVILYEIRLAWIQLTAAHARLFWSSGRR